MRFSKDISISVVVGGDGVAVETTDGSKEPLSWEGVASSHKHVHRIGGAAICTFWYLR